MNPRTRDADFGRTTQKPLIVSLAEVAGSTAGHIRVDLVELVTWIALPTELFGQQRAVGPFGLESARLTPKQVAFGVRRSMLIVSVYAKSRS
jgi:hypothetical protein